MKLILTMGMVCIAYLVNGQSTTKDTSLLQPVEVNAVKATDKNPFAKTNLTKQTIAKLNIGQDLPFILNQTQSVIVNSDAGNGIGYTGIRLRGSDAARVNITLNGIPYNDAESQGTFLVNIPDIASSAGSIQIQRGVGTSANGAGSFGGSINISTNEINKERNLELNSTAGSFESFKNTLIYNSGIFSKHFLIDARLSNIRSEGYVDRASSRLKSFYISSAYINDKSSLRLNVFTGKEKTYQAYYGVSEAGLDTNRTYNQAGTEKLDAPYENQTDNYTQTHYQAFYNHQFNKYIKTNINFFLTRGYGYYEQYKASQKLSNYGLPAFGSITSTDLVRQLWLDNHFYGSTFFVQYDKKHTQIQVGGGLSKYDGTHYGKIIWSKEVGATPRNYQYYNLDAYKKDITIYTKWTQKISNKVETYVDLQARNVVYNIYGFRGNPTLFVKNNYTFFNPKAGITYSYKNMKVYASYGRAAKEPNRDDFEANKNQAPTPEKLNDFETGIELKRKKAQIGLNLFYMGYTNQLVLNGKINDVGAATRVNIPKSYRAGIELSGSAVINKYLSVQGNVTLSSNKVKNFTDYVYNYDNDTQVPTLYNKADIAYSPNVISSLGINIEPFKNANISLTGKYVGKQFLDNTSNNNKKLSDYYTQDIRTAYVITGKNIKELNLFIQVNNLFSKKYEANGYTFSYISSAVLSTENYYFPMAPINFMLGVNIKL